MPGRDRDAVKDGLPRASRIAGISPGNRCSISADRAELCISTPRRSLRISPAARKTRKCSESVDLGTVLSQTPIRLEQLRGASEPASSA